MLLTFLHNTIIAWSVHLRRFMVDQDNTMKKYVVVISTTKAPIDVVCSACGESAEFKTCDTTKHYCQECLFKETDMNCEVDLIV